MWRRLGRQKQDSDGLHLTFTLTIMALFRTAASRLLHAQQVGEPLGHVKGGLGRAGGRRESCGEEENTVTRISWAGPLRNTSFVDQEKTVVDAGNFHLN